MQRTHWPLGVIAALAVTTALGACGSSAPAGSRSGNAVANAKKGVRFAQCMRRSGVSDFPDPSAGGRLTIDAVANGSSVDTSAPAFRHALAVCQGLEPAGFLGTPRSPRQQSAGLRFAQCVRDNGVKDFPDPVAGQPLVDTNRIPSSNTPAGMNLLNAAMHKCSAEAVAAGAGAGQ